MALPLAAAISASMAQEQPNPGPLEEVVVSALRKATVQELEASVSVLEQSTIESAALQHIQELVPQGLVLDAVRPFLVEGQPPLDESTVIGDRRAVTRQSQYHIQFGHAAQLLQILHETAWWLRLVRCGRIDDRIRGDVAQ